MFQEIEEIWDKITFFKSLQNIWQNMLQMECNSCDKLITITKDKNDY